MKIYIRSSDEYKGWKIYLDNKTNGSYIYTQPKGKGRINFPNSKEARQWIDENSPDTDLKTYIVIYVNSKDKSSYTEVEATDESDAEKKARYKLGSECYRITAVVEKL